MSTAASDASAQRASIERDLLVRLARLLASASRPAEILQHLAQAAVDHLDASAAAVLEVTGEGQLRVAAVASRPEAGDVGPALAELRLAVDAIGPDLAATLERTLAGRFEEVRTFPLVVETDLFGALVLVGRRANATDEGRLWMGSALADLAATSLAKAYQFARLAKAYSELEESREVLARTEKLRSLGEMAAGVSHDLRNILNPIGLEIELLRRRAGEPEAVRKSAERLAAVVRVGIDTLDRLRRFSRQRPDAGAEPVEIDRMVTEAAALCTPRLEGHHRLELVLGAPPPVRLEASELIQALVNLVANSVDAMTEGGTITIATGADGHSAWIDVEDTGPGMPPEIQRRVFEPFFTTKGAEGTGLGLATVYAFVQRQGGRITLDSVVGRGTTFRLTFPFPR